MRRRHWVRSCLCPFRLCLWKGTKDRGDEHTQYNAFSQCGAQQHHFEYLFGGGCTLMCLNIYVNIVFLKPSGFEIAS